MSSTNRGGQRSEADAYNTPKWAVRRLLERYPLALPRCRCLEPAAGEGRIIEAVNDRYSGLTWTAVEIRKMCKINLNLIPNISSLYIPEDFLHWTPDIALMPGSGFRPYDLSITNPPFSIATEFLLAQLELADLVVMLLRLNYWGARKRHELLSKRAPNHTFILPNRPSFAKGGGTDSIEYAWMVWEAGNPVSRGTVELLDLTPLAERQLEY